MLTIPSFQEDATPVIDLIKTYATIDGESPAALLERQQTERVRETARVMRALGRHRMVASVVLRWTHKSILLRERARLKQALLYARLRRVVLAIGDRLVSRGRIDSPDDLFFLTTDELDALVAGSAMFPDHVRHLVSHRRHAHADGTFNPPDSFALAEVNTSAHPTARPRGRGRDGDRRRHVRRRGLQELRHGPRDDSLNVSEAHRLTAGDILVTRQTDQVGGPCFR
jgi:pyruvate,water dikinase